MLITKLFTGRSKWKLLSLESDGYREECDQCEDILGEKISGRPRIGGCHPYCALDIERDNRRGDEWRDSRDW